MDLSKDEIRAKVGGSQQQWQHRRTGRKVRVISLVGMEYEYLRLLPCDEGRLSKKSTIAFFKEFDRVKPATAKDSK